MIGSVIGNDSQVQDEPRSTGSRMIRKTSREDWTRDRERHAQRGRPAERTVQEQRERSRSHDHDAGPAEAPTSVVSDSVVEDVTEALLNEIIEVFLVGNARTKEVKWSSLPEKVRVLFRAAMEKEWAKWEQFRATIPVTDTMLQKLPLNRKSSVPDGY